MYFLWPGWQQPIVEEVQGLKICNFSNLIFLEGDVGSIKTRRVKDRWAGSTFEINCVEPT